MIRRSDSRQGSRDLFSYTEGPRWLRNPPCAGSKGTRAWRSPFTFTQSRLRTSEAIPPSLHMPCLQRVYMEKFTFSWRFWKNIQQKSIKFVKQQQRYTLASQVTMTWTRRTLNEFVPALNHHTPKHSLRVTVHETTTRINFHNFADKAAILMLFNPPLIPYKLRRNICTPG